MSAVLAEAPIGVVIYDEPGAVYYQRVPFVASNSVLTIIDEDCPLIYRHWLDHPEDDETTDAMIFGNVFHTLALEPDAFDARYAVKADDAPKRPDKRQLAAFLAGRKQQPQSVAAIHYWQSWDLQNAGKIEVGAKDYDQAQAMVAAMRGHVMHFREAKLSITVGELIDACAKEVVVRWIDEDTGLLCKLRADLWSEELAFAGDLKSCLHAGKAEFARTINRRRYHVAHSHYCEGFRCAGRPLKSFALIATEKRRPHATGTWHVDAASEARGWDIRQRSMRKLAACRDSGRFPSYTEAVEPIGIPAFGHYDADKD